MDAFQSNAILRPSVVQPTARRTDSVQTGGKDLNKDLSDALSGSFQFTGSYYHCSTDPATPNPGLTIDDVGLIGLPLSEREAKMIISRAAQAPFGKGDKTVVDTSVRDTWEIEPANVSFTNPKWKEYINLLGSKIIPDALGVAKGIARPCCELYKLLVYQPGSHFLPHQDTSKADGMFATVVVVLPSKFEGGEVVVSHSQQRATLKISEHSAFSTSVLAWYTDVVHEVKPVTSGYRLALSYNLTHTSSQAPQPSLPDMNSGVEVIRRVLTSWKEGRYTKVPSLPVMAYLLAHQYSPNDLRRGLQGLKGADAHKLSYLLPIAKELGFAVCLANLTCQVVGTADDRGQGYNKRRRRGRGGYRRYDYDDDDDDDSKVPDMCEVESQTNQLSNLICVSDGKKFTLQDFELSDEFSLVPEEPFKDKEPNRKEYQGYMGNFAHRGIRCTGYERSVLVLFCEKDETKIMVSINGLEWATQELNLAQVRPSPPSARVQEIAFAVLSELAALPRGYTCGAPSSALALMGYALHIKDVELWNSVLPFSRQSVELAGQAISEALRVFSLPLIQAGINKLVRSFPGLQERYTIVKAIEARVGENTMASWADEIMAEVISSYTAAEVKDIPNLLWIAQRLGLETFQNILDRDILNMPGSRLTFLIALAKVLHDQRQSLIQSNSRDPASASSVTSLVGQCISAAVGQFETSLSSPHQVYSAASVYPTRAAQLCELVDLCLTVGDLSPCTVLLTSVLQANDRGVYAHLAPLLHDTLSKHGKRISAEPFASFFKHMISSYLARELGPKPATLVIPQDIGCGCQDCEQLDAFLKSSAQHILFKLLLARRNHLEHRIHQGNVGHLIWHRTDRNGTPHTLVVQKLPEVVLAYQWKEKQDLALRMVRSVGEDHEMAALMGERWGDVVNAILGKHVFFLGAGDMTLPVVGADAQKTSGAAGAAGPSAARASAGGGSVKRKQRGPP